MGDSQTAIVKAENAIDNQNSCFVQWQLTPNSLRLAKVKTAFALHEAIANWMGFEELSLLMTCLNSELSVHLRGSYVQRRDSYNRAIKVVFHQIQKHLTASTPSQTLVESDIEELCLKYVFYYKAITEGCNFCRPADVFSSTIPRGELLSLAHNLNEQPLFLFPSETTKAISALDPRKETTLHCLIAVLANKLDYSPDDKDTVGKINRLLDMEGIAMDNKTIRTNIKSAFETLNEKRE